MTSGLLGSSSDRLRVVPWQGSGRTALVAPLPHAPAPGADIVRRCVDLLAAQGVTHVITGALTQPEQTGFLAAGFEIREHLHLLAHDLGSVPQVAHGLRQRRAHRRDRPAVIALDHLSFDDRFWRLDEPGLADALAATASSRFRLAIGPGGSGVVGYAVTGRSGGRGYLQRLAVHPAHRRLGVGRALVVDGLHWLRRHGVERAVVNTQASNAAAISLYERIGFRRQPDGLAVLTRSTDPDGGPRPSS